MMPAVCANHHRDICVRDRALTRDRCGQNTSKRSPVGRDHQQGSVGELEGIAHLAAPEEVSGHRCRRRASLASTHPPPASRPHCEHGREASTPASLRCRGRKTKALVRHINPGQVGFDVKAMCDGILGSAAEISGIDRDQVAE